MKTTAVNDREARIALTHLLEPGDALLARHVQHQGATNVLGQLVDGTFEKWGEAEAALQDRFVNRDGQKELLLTVDPEIHVVVPGDAAWIKGLDDLLAPPLALFVKGDLDALIGWQDHPSVAFVGARAATSYGEHVTDELVKGVLSRHPHARIVSGMAYGIDGAAHRAALASGGKTIAFLAGGVDRPYPMGHGQLHEKIQANGAVISEVTPGTTPTRWRFLARNRLIAAASTATVVVEAGARSGSMNAAGHAAMLGRPHGAVPGPITSMTSVGCHRLIQDGAQLITSAADIEAMIGGRS